MAVKTGHFLNLLGFQWRFLLTFHGKIIFRRLKKLTATFIGYNSRLVCYLPIGADSHGMALVATTRRRDAFPGREHGAPCDRDEKAQNCNNK